MKRMMMAIVMAAAGCTVETQDAVDVTPTTTGPSETFLAPVTSATPETTTTEGPKGFDEVTVTECYTEDTFDILYMGARGQVTNSSSKTSDYWITVRVKDANGVQLDTTSAYAQTVTPGATALWDTGSFTKLPEGTDPATITCEKADVMRTAS